MDHNGTYINYKFTNNSKLWAIEKCMKNYSLSLSIRDIHTRNVSIDHINKLTSSKKFEKILIYLFIKILKRYPKNWLYAGATPFMRSLLRLDFSRQTEKEKSSFALKWAIGPIDGPK